VNIPGEIRQKIISEFENTNVPVRTKTDKREQVEKNGRGRVAGPGYLSEKRQSIENYTVVIPLGTLIDSQREPSGLPEPSVSHLFPAWKCLVKIMNYDSLVRFKAREETFFRSIQHKPSADHLVRVSYG